MTTNSLPPCVKLTGGKRGAPGPLIVTTSDEDSCSDGEPQASPRAPLTTRISPRSNITDTFHPTDTYHPNLKLDLHSVIRTDARSETKTDLVRPRASSPSPTPNPHQQAFDAYEHDHDYENVASPSGSSTASGPIYVRPPGFQHHAHEIRQETRRKKKKPTGLLDRREGIKSRAPTPPKVKARRGNVIVLHVLHACMPWLYLHGVETTCIRYVESTCLRHDVSIRDTTSTSIWSLMLIRPRWNRVCTVCTKYRDFCYNVFKN